MVDRGGGVKVESGRKDALRSCREGRIFWWRSMEEKSVFERLWVRDLGACCG